MNRILSSLLVAGLVVLTLGAAPKPMLKITVEQEKDTDRDVRQRSTSRVNRDGNTEVTPEQVEKTQKVTLAIKIQSLSPGELKGLRVKYALFSRNIETRDVHLAAEGEKTADIKPPTITTVKADPATFSAQETKFKSGDIDSRHNRVSGEKYYGCAVIIYRGDEKLAASYTPDSLATEAPKLGW